MLAGALLLGGILSGVAYASPPGLVQVTSHNSFQATVMKLKAAVGEHGLMILKQFNQQMMLAMVGVHAQPEMTFEIFHPKYGKVVYAADPVDFLAVPLRILVRQNGGTVTIDYQKPSTVLGPVGLSGLGSQLDPVLHAIAEAAAQ
ncbi:secreted protein containing DUF302 [mine drainage metagenome]|uniref:Secreted protein containing DUF302 n=1 Tax=mine drainage metagenome TaxID=410659 RepID=T1CKS1_9ZZZZ